MRSMRRGAASFAGACLVLAGASCSGILGLNGLVADREGSTTGDGGGDGSGGDACGAACLDGALSDSGLAVVPLPDGGVYGIDPYEVTFAQYRAWLATGPSIASQTPECAWNDSFEPGSTTQSAVDIIRDAGSPFDPSVCTVAKMSALGANKPVVCVDWCDAIAYCAGNKKHLCGRVGGGTLDYTRLDAGADPSKEEWLRACSNGGAKVYPYGNTHIPARCNDETHGVENVGSYADCVGGVPGLFDMSGNVWEWTNVCAHYSSPDSVQNCLKRGGAYYSGPTELQCALIDDVPRGIPDDATGFRCCGDL